LLFDQDNAMFELTLRAPQALVEPVSDLLMDELGALSVSVEDADAGTHPAGTGQR
jgi:ribosomal protein L11 methyltransferase